MAPISALTGKAPFVWGPEQEAAFVKLKAMVPLALTPIDWSRIESGEHHLYVFGDASITGINRAFRQDRPRRPLDLFEVTYGYQPSPWPVDAWSSTDVPAADGFAELIRLNWLKATDAIIGDRLDMALQANKHRRPDSAEFSVGNRVYVDTKDLSFPASMTRKFHPRYLGPFLITAANPSSSNYDIAFPPHFRVHPRVHASKLRPFFANDESRFPARHFSTPPALAPADAANCPG